MKTKKYLLLAFLIPVLMWFFPITTFAAFADIKLNLEVVCPEGTNCPALEERDEMFFSPAVLKSNDQFKVNLRVENPSSQSIISAQTWLLYDTEKLEGVSIETFDMFNLVAPGEKDFDVENGRVKVGVANTSGGVSAADILIATITFKVKEGISGTTDLKFYDYQVSELGHTNVNIIADGFPLNVLETSPKGLMLSLSEQASLPPDVGGPPVSNQSTYFAAINRPSGVKLTTGNSYAYLAWDIEQGVGYNIYYGNRSGYYLHKMDVGMSDSFYVTNLNNDQTYYFAIKSYDTNGNESDYSDEVAIIINHPDSSTSPLNIGIADIASTKSGPSTVLFLALIAGSVGYMFSRKKKMSLSEV